MTDNDLLTMLKTDLGIKVSTTYDARLAQYINTAKAMIQREGIVLDMTAMEDCSLVVQYAGWMWRKRDTMEAMPMMLRIGLNNRLFAQKMSLLDEGDENA